jgi:hypothetical protein
VIVRVIVEALKLSKVEATVRLNEVAEKAGTTAIFAELVLADLVEPTDGKVTFADSSTRFKLAIEAVRLGALLQVARALTWQEFESFSEECLRTIGFHTRKGVMVRDDSRLWQIDIIAIKDRMILVIDCKHWESPGYDSKLRKAAEHQKLALAALIQQMTTKGKIGGDEVLALPIILTLFEPSKRLVNGVVVVSVEQFADFLEGISPYSSELPFISVQNVSKSSIN